jgi:hypothetical protein
MDWTFAMMLVSMMAEEDMVDYCSKDSNSLCYHMPI